MDYLKHSRNKAEEEWRRQTHPNKTIDNAHNEYIRQIQRSLYYCKFKLQRDGIIELLIPQRVYPERESQDPLIAPSIVAGEMYFFLKEITHAHKHHDPQSDRVIDIYARPIGKSNNWKARVSANLHRHIIENQRRSPLELMLQRAIGILAYYESFTKTIRSSYQGEQATAINFDLLRQSIKSKLAEHSFHTKSKEYRITTTIATLAALTAFSSIGLTDSAKKALPPGFQCTAEAAFQHFNYILAIGILLSAYYVSTKVRRLLSKLFRTIARPVYRLFGGMHKYTQGLLWTILGVLLIYNFILNTLSTDRLNPFDPRSIRIALQPYASDYLQCIKDHELTSHKVIRQGGFKSEVQHPGVQ